MRVDSGGYPQYAFFALLPAFTAGAYDGVNPCGFATALILMTYLGFVGYTQRRIFWFGLLFILSAALTHFALALGIFDPILTVPVILKIIRFTYWLLAAGFLIFGIMDILDSLIRDF